MAQQVTTVTTVVRKEGPQRQLKKLGERDSDLAQFGRYNGSMGTATRAPSARLQLKPRRPRDLAISRSRKSYGPS